MNFTALRSKWVLFTLIGALMGPSVLRADDKQHFVLDGLGVGRLHSSLVARLAPKCCILCSTTAERVPLLSDVAHLRNDSAPMREMPLSLSGPKNNLVRVSWNHCHLDSGACIVAYSLLGYEYLRQDVRKGVTAAFIDTRQLLSGIYVLRLETPSGQPLGYARLVVEHNAETQTRN